MSFRDRNDFELTFVDFLKDLAVDDKTGAVAKTGLVIVYRVTDFGFDIVTDSTIEPRPGAAYELYTVPRYEGKATVIYEAPSEVMDRVYLGTLPPIVALARGEVTFHGAHLITIVKARKGLENAIPLYRAWRARIRKE